MSIGVLQTVLPVETLTPVESLESLVREAKEGLSFDRTISRRFVHRASVTEVFLTDAAVAGADRFLVGAQLPRNHALYRPETTGQCDFMLLVETVRQAGIFLSHRYHDVPLGHHFIFKALSLRIGDPAALRVGCGPLAVVLDVKVVTPAGGRNPRRFDARFDMVIEVGGRECARASAGVVVIDSVRYGRLRQRGRVAETAPVEPGTPAYGTAADDVDDRHVLRSVPAAEERPRPAGAREWRLHVDPTHPGYFEHPSDHVPGMLLLEAFRQAAREATGGAALTSLDADFAVFGELAEAVAVEAAPTEDGRVRLSATQGGRVLATAVARCA
ncbi:ScbA/BarX family gamma-butyrolactone biosynthesis protein [Streptomyces sp. TLI_105]|uniref:ScbA/BarX family gamma-butyrolactone biosynthesis protein n=1 Tax=Streptomyces sp. TLI_105 TaxID=1881019 RepID=UPI000895CEE5|nr:ScbA/BarX family gamma-butyrolactone biosynthesis protein [Streptomyces sp. TLI_105]SEC79123.1 A-factor biosynthesis hotdog domain-containing protein [Streptomyces sp. TLI_105]